jgi:hypothetical protein
MVRDVNGDFFIYVPHLKRGSFGLPAESARKTAAVLLELAELMEQAKLAEREEPVQEALFGDVA